MTNNYFENVKDILYQLEDIHDALTVLSSDDAIALLSNIYYSNNDCQLLCDKEPNIAINFNDCLYCINSFELDYYMTMLENQIYSYIYC